jgi:hypothetical protein
LKDDSQGSGGIGVGNVDFTPWGAAYSERDAQSVLEKTGAAHVPLVAGDGNISAADALGQAQDDARWQGGYLSGAGLATWQSGKSRSGWQSQEDYAQLGQTAYDRACFLAGTPLLTPEGSKRIEQLRVGDKVLARAEDDPAGEVVAKSVEETFVRTGRIMIVRVNSRQIGTTAEHPFWVRGIGWLPAGELTAGMELSSHDGQWVPVEKVRDTGEFETVYNLRVADFHTYFVGERNWGWSAWAHNTYDQFLKAFPELKDSAKNYNFYIKAVKEYKKLQEEHGPGPATNTAFNRWWKDNAPDALKKNDDDWRFKAARNAMFAQDALTYKDDKSLPREVGPPTAASLAKPQYVIDGEGKKVKLLPNGMPGKDFKPLSTITKPYPHGLVVPTTAQKNSVQGKPCTHPGCNKIEPLGKQIPDHILALVGCSRCGITNYAALSRVGGV